MTTNHIGYAVMADEIENALYQLGYEDPENYTMTLIDDTRAEITRDDAMIGIYDFAKHTFVD